MGLTPEYLDWMHECINATLGGLRGKRMLELGNQTVDRAATGASTGKEYFTKRGAEHISVDLNGLDGALKLDLSKPVQFLSWHGRFDIITNSGTSEHVEPLAAQYECFQIIHDCLKVGGIALHIVPDIEELESKGCWKGHCKNYYSKDFFRMLAKNNNYKSISLKVSTNGNICACLQKTKAGPFMNERKEFLKYITRRSGGIIYPGINAPKAVVLLISFKRLLRRLVMYGKAIAKGLKI